MVDCLIKKLKQRGFTVGSSKEAAEAILIIDTLREGWTEKGRHQYPRVGMTVVSRDGRILWKGESKYYKWTVITLNDDDCCPRANGITKKLVKAMKKK